MSRELSVMPGSVQSAGDRKYLTGSYRHGNRVPIIGFSATFARVDKRALAWVYEDVVSYTEVEELLQQLL